MSPLSKSWGTCPPHILGPGRNHNMPISYHKNGLVSNDQTVRRWFIFMCFVIGIFWGNWLSINSLLVLLVSVPRWNSWLELSCRYGGDLVGLSPPNKAPSPPNWNIKHYKLVEYFSSLNVKPHYTNVKPPIDDFLATVLGWNHFALMWIVFTF